MRLPKFSDKRTGWWGESCINRKARQWIKRLEHRHNRQQAKKECKRQTLTQD